MLFVVFLPSFPDFLPTGSHFLLSVCLTSNFSVPFSPHLASPKTYILPANLYARKLVNQTCLMVYKLYPYHWSHFFIHSYNKHFLSILNQECQALYKALGKEHQRPSSCIWRAHKPVGTERRYYKMTLWDITEAVTEFCTSVKVA